MHPDAERTLKATMKFGRGDGSSIASRHSERERAHKRQNIADAAVEYQSWLEELKRQARWRQKAIEIKMDQMLSSLKRAR